MKQLQDCELCPRLSAFRRQQKGLFPGYHCRPVAALGAADARLLIVGLAPGLHGANASGIPFCGDASGERLYAALHRHGFADRAQSTADAPAKPIGCRITNAVKCLPPDNRPNAGEVAACNPYLRAEIATLSPGAVLLALGGIAHRAILQALELRVASRRFAHLAEHALPRELRLLDSYHCSRYNFNTRRLDEAAFDAVFGRLREMLA